MKRMFQSLYSREFDFEAWRGAPTKTVAIATIPRTGSSWLGTALWKTGHFGAPLEYFNLNARMRDGEWRPDVGDLGAYLANLTSRRTSPNGVFSYKLFTTDIVAISKMDPSFLSCITSDFTIYLRRRDRLRQAVSYARANRGGSWFLSQDPVARVDYDYGYVNEALGWIFKSENRWNELFRIKGCKPICIFYEDIIEYGSLGIRALLKLCDVETFSTLSEVSLPDNILGVQRDQATELWVERFERDANKRAESFKNNESADQSFLKYTNRNEIIKEPWAADDSSYIGR